MSEEKTRYTAIDLSVSNKKGALAEAFDQGVYADMDSKQFAQYAYHVGEVKRGNVNKIYNLITILALFTGSEEDFVRLQEECKIPPELAIDRAKFYSQLISYANNEEAPFGYHPFVGFCLKRVKEMENSTKKLKAPTVIEYLEVLRADRLGRDANLEDQFFDRKDAFENRGFIIPKGIIPISGKLNSKNAIFDTMNAVPKHFFYRYGIHKHSYKAYKDCVLKPNYRDYWPDAPLIRSRMTDRSLFSMDAEVMPNFDEKLKALGDAFGTEIKVNDMQAWDEKEAKSKGLSVLDFDDVIDHSYRFTDDRKNRITTVRRWRIHTSNDELMLPRPVPERKGSKVLRCKVNDYEVFAFAVKAVVAREAVERSFMKEYKKEHKKFVRDLRGLITANGGKHARKLAKIYEPFFTDMAGYITARNAMYAYNFEENQDLTAPNTKSINLSLDQGLEFAFGNKLSAFHDLSARWVLPCIQYMANDMTYQFYKKMNISPRQVAEGMARVGVKCGTIRDIPAEEATKDDYAMVLYDTVAEFGNFDPNYGVDEDKPEVRKIKVKNQDDKKYQNFEEIDMDDFDIDAFEKSLITDNTVGNADDFFRDRDERKATSKVESEVVSEVESSNINESEKVSTGETEVVVPEIVEVFEAKAQELKEEKVSEIEEVSSQRQKIVEGIVSQSTEEPKVVPNETFESVIAKIDDKDPIDVAIENGQTVNETTNYINESNTANNIIVETFKGASSKDSVIYVDDKGNAYYSKTAMESNNILPKNMNELSNNDIIEKVDVSQVKVEKRKSGVAEHIDIKIRKTLFRRFNSDLQKEKIKLENTLKKRLATYEGKKIPNAVQQKLNTLSKKIDFFEGLIMSNIECLPELAKMNKFSNAKVMSDWQLINKAKSKDLEERKFGIVQKEMVNLANQLTVGIERMVREDPEKYSGKSITQLISDFRKQEFQNEKDYMNEVVKDVVTRLDEFEPVKDTESNNAINEGGRTNDR